MRTRLFAAVAALIAVSLLGPTPAHAVVPTPYAIDDVDNVNFPRGDITAMRLHVAPAKIVWTITLRRGVDLNSPAWGVTSASTIVIPMDTVDGAPVDWRIEVASGITGATGQAVDLRPTPSKACIVQLDQPGSLRTIRIRVSRECIDDPAEVRGRITYSFDAGNDGDIDSVDRAPDNGFTPQVRP